jgi:branched-chain amino acid transport system permease protein
MITLAVAQMMYFFYLQTPFTHGEDGIQSVPRGRLFGLIDLANPYAMYYTVLAIFLLAFLFIYRVIHSPFGQVLKAIRENEPRAISLGTTPIATSSSRSCCPPRWPDWPVRRRPSCSSSRR